MGRHLNASAHHGHLGLPQTHAESLLPCPLAGRPQAFVLNPQKDTSVVSLKQWKV